MISFEWPWAFALAVLPWVVARVWPRQPMQGAITLPISADLERIAGNTGVTPRTMAPLLAAWLALSAAAAQPVLTGVPLPLPVMARDLMLAIDLSASMREKDVDASEPDRSRLDVALDAAAAFLRRREGDRVGLVVFGSQAYVYAPLTVDRASVATLVGDLGVGLAGDATAIGDAIAAAVKVMTAPAPSARVVILLTDGENTAGSVPPAKAAELAAAAGVRVHTIGFGAPVERNVVLQRLELQASPVVTAPLREVAKRTGGRFFRARNAGELEDVYRELDRMEPVSGAEQTFVPRLAVFHWPLALAVLLAGIALLRRLERR